MPHRPRTTLQRRVRVLCICAWVVLVLALPVWWLGTLGPEWRGGTTGLGGTAGYRRDESGAVVAVKANVRLESKWWVDGWVGKTASVTFRDEPVDEVSSRMKLSSPEELRERVRPWFDDLCKRQGCPELVSLFDDAIANGGIAEVTYPRLYIFVAARRVTSYWVWGSLALVLVTTTWLASLVGPAVGGLCGGCGYDLSGLGASAVCPECGKERG